MERKAALRLCRSASEDRSGSRGRFTGRGTGIIDTSAGTGNVSITADSVSIHSLSSINAGANAGINVLYSGTVAAAIEGAFFRRTAIAVSQAHGKPKAVDFAAGR